MWGETNGANLVLPYLVHTVFFFARTVIGLFREVGASIFAATSSSAFATHPT